MVMRRVPSEVVKVWDFGFHLQYGGKPFEDFSLDGRNRPAQLFEPGQGGGYFFIDQLAVGSTVAFGLFLCRLGGFGPLVGFILGELRFRHHDGLFLLFVHGCIDFK